MNLSACVSCNLPVLELEGQFAKLDSYYVGHDGPPPETAGWWHTRCLADSPHAAAWCRARLRNFVEVRGGQVVERLPHWTVVKLPHWTVVKLPRDGEILAFGESGELLSVPADRADWRRVPGGVLRPISEPMFNLECEADLIAAIQRGLTSEAASYPLIEVMRGLGIAERVMHPVALAGGAFHFVPGLREYWSKTSIAAQAEYTVFIPEELMSGA